MSNINNKTQDLFALDTVQDLDNESAAAIQGGAKAVELFADSDFRTKIIDADFNDPNLGDNINRANDSTTSIKINRGEWIFYSGSNFRGHSVTLKQGQYANVGLRLIPNDSISSFRRVGSFKPDFA
jgi:hypothetical protein